jgi:hypothetical protein
MGDFDTSTKMPIRKFEELRCAFLCLRFLSLSLSVLELSKKRIAMDEHSHTEPPSEPTLHIKALESLLVEKGLVDPGAVDEIIDLFEKRIGPRNGARVVAHAWADPT